MRKCLPWAAIGTVVLLLATPAAASAHGGTEVIVSGDVYAGGAIELQGEGFDPGGVVRIELQRANSAPIELGSVPADEDGDWSATLHMPADARPGRYQLVAIGEDESASLEVTVRPPADTVGAGSASRAPDVSNDRPAGETAALVVLALALAAGGAALLRPGRGAMTRRKA